MPKADQDLDSLKLDSVRFLSLHLRFDHTWWHEEEELLRGEPLDALLEDIRLVHGTSEVYPKQLCIEFLLSLAAAFLTPLLMLGGGGEL